MEVVQDRIPTKNHSALRGLPQPYPSETGQRRAGRVTVLKGLRELRKPDLGGLLRDNRKLNLKLRLWRDIGIPRFGAGDLHLDIRRIFKGILHQYP